MKTGKLRERVRFTDKAFEPGEECIVAEAGSERDQIMQAMRDEYPKNPYTNTFFGGVVKDRLDRGDLIVIKINGDRWRLVAAARIEVST